MSSINKYIIFLITASLLIAISVQIYWNYKNYYQIKQQVINDIEQCLNDVIDEYYSGLAKESYITVASSDRGQLTKAISLKNIISINKPSNITSITISKSKEDTLQINKADIKLLHLDSSKTKTDTLHIIKKLSSKNKGKNGIKIYQGKQAADSLKLISTINTIIIALKTEGIEYSEVDSALQKKLEEKNIQTKFILQHTKDKKLIYPSDTILDTKELIKVQAQSAFIKPEEEIFLLFQNPIISIFKRSLIGILLSLLLSASIIFSLFYLLRVIRRQKQIDEMKNDLISNVTHEFKTPIATATTAIEALRNFDAQKDTEKTEKYLQISHNQLTNLYEMVEKLLETASINSEDIEMQTEPTNLHDLLTKLSSEFSLLTDKPINFRSDCDECFADIDIFHFRNAIANIIDNAIKYGGNIIEISLTQNSKQMQISIADNGKGIVKQHQDKIFSKFYRIPQGNKHNVKGSGIGLYYTNEIVKKHGGSVKLLHIDNKTVFRITLG